MRLLSLLSASLAAPRVGRSMTVRLSTTAIGASAFAAARRAALEQPWSAKLPIDTFLERSGVLDVAASRGAPHILDVRAPCEYAQGHLPGAVNVPLFNDAERAEIGTLYKERGHDVAVARGLDIVEAKGVDGLLAPAPELVAGDEVLVYCARGGMRSGGMAQLLAQAPLHVSTLEGGYKRFRNWALEAFQEPRPVVMLSGKTGSGKTDVLHALRDELGAQVLDLEGEARHRGSIFGALGKAPQPTSEHFENLLAVGWAATDPARAVFVEDESHNVGRCGVPRGLWARMRDPQTPVLRLAVPHEARLQQLVREYGPHGPAALSACVTGLTKKLGGARVAELVGLLEQETEAGLAEVADALLVNYYDAMYEHQMKVREGTPTHIVCESGDATANARRVLDAAASLGLKV